LTEIKIRKKLIEVALPLDAINASSAHEKMPGIGPHPRGLHQWWARRPLCASRAVIFSQIIDDPSEHPDLFPTKEAQDTERQRLFKLIEQLVLWENTDNQELLRQAHDEICGTWQSICADNEKHPDAAELFNPENLPSFHDPFAGGGALPLEAQRLGLESHASDLNPVAVLINKAMIEIPPKFKDQPPVNPAGSTNNALFEREWSGVRGLVEDVRYYGKWMLEETQKRIGHLYPQIEVTTKMVKTQPELSQYSGKTLPAIAWIWARTVKSPDPAFRHIEVPLVSSFMLSNKKGKQAYVEPHVTKFGYQFNVRKGTPEHIDKIKSGTKISRARFRCLMSGSTITADYIKNEASHGRMKTRLMAIVVGGTRERVYISPIQEHESIALDAKPDWRPEVDISGSSQYMSSRLYGFKTFDQLFTDRQLTTLGTLAELVKEAQEKIWNDAIKSNTVTSDIGIESDQISAESYAQAVSIYLAFAVDRCADFSNSIAGWGSSNEKVMHLFSKQAIPMTWDFAEAAILNDTVGGFGPAVDFIAKCIMKLPSEGTGRSSQQDALNNEISNGKIISTDPPYYDNVPYADLSDFFYVWLRKSLQTTLPSLFTTIQSPKIKELVAFAHRHDDSKNKARSFFLESMTRALQILEMKAHPAFPITIFYAFKQSEIKSGLGVVRTGWESFLEALIKAGFSVTGTWPIRSEQQYRTRALAANALASSIVLVCRKRNVESQAISKRNFSILLAEQLNESVKILQENNMAPVDVAQACIGPGIEIYTNYSKIVEASGDSMSVGDCLRMITETLDRILAEQEGNIDSDTRFAVRLFETARFSEADYGIAQGLAVAMVVSVEGVARAGVIKSGRGKVKLLRPSELSSDWNPTTDSRLTVWEVIHHLIKNLDSGEESAARIYSNLSNEMSAQAKGLTYRLYSISEQKDWAEEAFQYNSLIQSWPEIERLSRLEAPAQQGSLI